MKRSIIWAAGAGLAAAVAVAVGVGTAQAEPPENDKPITGDALATAGEAALAHTGGGKVTETEVGDEESRYEVEVTKPGGEQVDVQLDEGFRVVGSKTDRTPDDADGPR